MRMSKRRWFGVGLLGFVAVIIAMSLLSTFALKVGFNQVPGLSTVLGVSGRAIGPIAAQQLVWSQDGLTITVDGLDLDHAPFSLLSGRVNIIGISVSRIHVALPPALDEPAPASGPFRLDLPSIDLPFDVSSATLSIDQIVVVDAAGETLVDTDLQLSSFSLIDGVIEITELASSEQTLGSVALTAKLDSKRAWAGEVSLQASLLEPVNSQISVHSAGDLTELALEITSTGEVQADLQAKLSQLSTQPTWEMVLTAALADNAGLKESLPAGPVAVELSGSGGAESAAINGSLQAAGYAVDLVELALALADGSVRIDSADVAVQGQVSAQIQAEGHWPLSLDGEAGDLNLRWQELSLADAEPNLTSASGELVLTGFQDAYALMLDAQLMRGELAGTIRATGDGSDQGLSDLILRLDSSAGQVNINGDYQFTPMEADVQIAAVELKPELLVTDWPGMVSLQARVQVRDNDGVLSSQADIAQLSGQLRGGELSGEGSMEWVAESWPTGSMSLGWAGNQVDYSRNADSPGRLSVDARNLRIGTPDLDGRLQLDLQVPQQLAEWIDVTGTAKASNLVVPGLQLERLSASRPAGSATPVTIQGSGLRTDAVVLDSFDGELAPGAVGDWNIMLAALGPEVSVELDAQLAGDDQGWAGSVSKLQAQQQPWPAVTLVAPAQWSWADGELAVQRSCLAIDDGELCLSAQSTSAGVDLPSDLAIDAQLAKISLQPLRHLNSELDLVVSGVLDGTLQARVLGQGGFSIAAAMSAPQVELSLPGQDDERITRNLSLEIAAGPGEQQPQEISLTLRSALGGALVVNAQGDPLAARPDWLLDLQSQALDLRLIDGLSPELVGPRGTLSGELQARFVDGQLAPQGELRLSGVGAELPSAGTKVSELDLLIGALPEGRLNLRGGGKLGDGQFEIEGSVTLDETADARLVLKGQDLLVADLPIVRMTVSPDLQIERSDGKVTANGSVTIPSAMIDLARFEPTVQASSDVVVVDDETDEGEAVALFADIRVVVGDDVRLKGFGLDGRLSGSLSLRERPGKLATGRGELDVTGNYRAYGQDLDIQRGKVLFTGGPVGNPGLDLLALRELDRVKVGVRVRGAADRPVLAIYSDPVMDQAEALSYLILGRPLNSASGNDGAQLGAAAAALGSVGGSLLASKLGAGTGLEVGVESSSDLGGAALTVGRFLTPELYFGVGQSLFESLSVAILRYRLSESWELEGISGREFKAGVNYKMER